MNKLKFRPLNKDEIQCRPQIVKNKGCSLLLYKDARVDMEILDETVGKLNWQRKHKVIDGKLYCCIEIWDEDKEQWISKSDVGVESNSDKEKGQSSDAFKRACFNFGIGRELYTAPFIWVNLGNNENVKKLRFDVYHYKVEEGKITELGLQDQNGEKRFKWQK